MGPVMEDKARLFIVAGMPRSGTSFMYHNLQKHPQLFLPYRKETAFFGGNYDRGIEWFEKLFEDNRGEKYCVDITPYYSLDPKTAQRILSYSTDVRVVICARKPSSIALSLYTQLAFSEEMPSFSKFTDRHKLLIGRNSSGRCTLEVSLKDGILMDVVLLYREAFGDNLLLLDYELFKRDTCLLLRAIESFLGLDGYFIAGSYDDIVINASSRRSLPFTEKLIRNEGFVSLIGKLLPRRLVQIIRAQFEKLRIPNKSGISSLPYSGEDSRYAREMFVEQDAACSAIFTDSQLVLGSGRPFQLEN